LIFFDEREVGWGTRHLEDSRAALVDCLLPLALLVPVTLVEDRFSM
jgi:hypothetical protein